MRRFFAIALMVPALAGNCLLRATSAAPPPPAKQSTIRLVSAVTASSAATGDFAEPLSEQPPDPWPEPSATDSAFENSQPPPSFSEPSLFSTPPTSLEDYAADAQFYPGNPDQTHADSFFTKLRWLGFRHSSTDGRNAGMGVPLMGTSWLNRPYFVGADIGMLWVTEPPRNDITRDQDLTGSLFVGYDCDHYWGTELVVQRATPELINENARDARRGDRLMIWTANALYYPWGDSTYRPYWRCGLGAMEIDFPTDDGERRDEALWAFPIGVGVKYPVRRWLVASAEFTDNIGVGNSGVATQHNLSLTLALEWRFGGHRKSYWPWHPSRHIW